MISNKKLESDILASDLKYFENLFGNSAFLLEMGISDSVSQNLENARSKPLQFLLDGLFASEKHILLILNNIVENFFKKQKRYILRVFNTTASIQTLHYSIVLKKDDYKTRNKIRDFLFEYDSVPFSKRFPIYFQFIEEKHIIHLNNATEIKWKI
jgi:hypothetical protein